jgi:putative GTP pyrophosphokinase
MEYSANGNSDIDSWKEVMLVYNSALKEMGTKLEILNDEFQHVHSYNPIEHIKSRMKTSESIVRKLKNDGYEATIDNMIKYVNDIAGVRIICSFTTDIYRIVEMLRRQSDLRILSVKDYIKNPKSSGYRSYHMIVSIPIFLSERKVDVKVEIQIRTVAMDFWASLEHKINYKFDDIPEHIKEELLACSQMVAELDDKMLSLNDEVQEFAMEQV